MSYTTHKYGPLQPMSRCVYFFRFNSTRPLSCHGYRWYSGGDLCDENIYYTITCSCVYSATALGKFRRDCLLKSDISFGNPRFNDIIMRYEHLCARQLRRAQRKQSTVTRQSRLTVTAQNKGADKAAWDAHCLLNQLSPVRRHEFSVGSFNWLGIIGWCERLSAVLAGGSALWCNLNLKIISPGSRTWHFTVLVEVLAD